MWAELQIINNKKYELLIEGAIGATDLDILHAARFRVDLVGANPDNVEIRNTTVIEYFFWY